MHEPIFQNFAPLYWAAGLPVIPLRQRNKMPEISQWQIYGSRMPTDAEMQNWLRSFAKGNVGLPLGPASGICVIDIDTENAELDAAIREICGPTPWVRVGKKGAALAYRFEGQKNFKLKGADGMICELLGLRNQVVLPPSIHPDTGLPYTATDHLWEVLSEIPPLGINIEDRLRSALIAAGHLTSPSGARSRPVPVSQTTCGSTSRFARWLMDHLNEAVKELGKKVEGERNNSLFLAAVQLAEDVAAAGDDWTPYANALRSVALTIGLEEVAISSTLASAWRKGQESPTPWISLAQEWIYVSGADQFLHLESGERLTQQAFKTEFNHLAPLKKQGNIAKFVTDFGFVDMVQNLSFDPQKSEGIFSANGRRWLNTYRPPSVVAEPGDAAPFREFIEYLVPDAVEREHLLKVFAHLVRKPGEKLNHAVIFGSRAHGIGKSTLMEILFELIGPSNCRKATTEEIESPYQSYIEGKLLVLVEEINFGVGRKAYNKMKDMITSPMVPVRRLYQETRNVPNMANFFFLTNISTPLLVDEEDRRVFMIDSQAEPRDAAYYTELNRWWRSSLGVIRGFLDEVNLEDFNPHARPPMTAAKAELIKNSQMPVVQELAEMIDERHPPFRTDVVVLGQVVDAVRRRLPNATRNAIQSGLHQIGAASLGQHRIAAGSSFPARAIGIGDRPSLWAVRNAGFWAQATSKEIVEEYLADASRLSDLPDIPEEWAISPISILPRIEASQSANSPERILALIRALAMETSETVE